MENSIISEKMSLLHKLEAQKKNIEAEYQRLLGELRDVAGKSTFKVGGQWYQVRSRKGLRYMCLLDGPPRGRPRKEEVAAKAAEAAPAPDEPVVEKES